MIADLTWVIGWTLIHFVWQGALAALLTAIALDAVAARSANLRYAVACAGLVSMASAAGATAAWTWAEIDQPAVSDGLIDARASVTPTGLPRGDGARFAAAERALPAPAAPRTPALPLVPELVLPTVVITWLLGVAVLLGRLAGGLWQIRRVRRASQDLPASAWQATCQRLMEQLGLSSAVRVVESTCVDVPTVIGSIRPMILLPVAALANLTPGQVEAILRTRSRTYGATTISSISCRLLPRRSCSSIRPSGGCRPGSETSASTAATPLPWRSAATPSATPARSRSSKPPGWTIRC